MIGSAEWKGEEFAGSDRGSRSYEERGEGLWACRFTVNMC